MARVYTNGWEYGSKYWETDGPATPDTFIVTSPVRSGTYAMRLESADTVHCHYFASGTDEIYMGVALYNQSGDSTWYNNVYVTCDNGYIFALQMRRDIGSVRIYNNALGTSSTLNNIIPIGSGWVYFEMHIKLGVSDGEFTLKASGEQVLQLTGNTGASTSLYRLSLYANPYNQDLIFDDIVVNDTTGDDNNFWTGQPRLIRVRPNAAGSNTEWTPSTGDNYTCVDEVTPSSSDYVTAPASGLLDSYNISTGVSSTAIINNVILHNVAAVDTGGSNILPAVVVSGVAYYAPASGILTEQYKIFENVWSKNPHTDQPWTYDDIVNLEIGQKS
jgi:hypothetical protein